MVKIMRMNFFSHHFIMCNTIVFLCIMFNVQMLNAHQAPHNPWALTQSVQPLQNYHGDTPGFAAQYTQARDTRRQRAGFYPVYGNVYSPYVDPLSWDMNMSLSPYLSLYPGSYGGLNGFYPGIYRPYLPFLYQGW